MCVKIKIKNKSSRDIPAEIADIISETSLDKLNEIAADYNLKIIEMTKEYNKKGILTEQEFVIGDRYVKED
jgi:uncharacterized HAD superfamily protein